MKQNTPIRDYEAAEFLDTDEMIYTYISDVLQDGTETEIKTALANVVKAKNITEIAKKMGLKREELAKVLFEKEDLQFTIVQRLLNAMNIKLNVVAV